MLLCFPSDGYEIILPSYLLNMYTVKFGKGAKAPGAQSAKDSDMSPAERVKFGPSSESASSRVQSASNVDVSNAERLKFGSGGEEKGSEGLGRGAHDGSQVADSNAVRLKFGAAAEPESRGGMKSSDSSQSSLEEDEEEGLEMREKEDSDDAKYEKKRRKKKKQDDFKQDSFDDVVGNDMVYDEDGEAYDLQPVDDPYGMPTMEIARDSDGKTKRDDGWRSLCAICSCISCAIIIGLSVGLARAASSSSDEVLTPVEVKVTSPPSKTPTLTPTKAPEDFTWCYESNESMALEDDNYASIRSTLVNSGISTDEEFADDASYQRKALCWLAFGDRLELDASDPFIEQRYALAVIYYRFNEPSLLEAEGWLSGKSECSWNPSIECDDRTDTTVTRLDLRGVGLQGPLPNEMRVLRDVTYLDLSSNELDGDISDITADWSHLEELRLSSNFFGSFPSAIQAWRSLKYFDMSSNELEGPIPEDLALLTQLEFLDLAANAFNSTIPSVMGGMTALESLYLHSNELEGSMPETVCALRSSSLKHLSVDCRIPSPEVRCDCCSVCNDYDVDRSPFD